MWVAPGTQGVFDFACRSDHAMKAATRTMPSTATPDDLFKRLQELGIVTETHDHPPVFTIEESRALRGAMPGAHCKTLYFKDKKGVLWLCVVEESRRMNIRALSNLIGSARLSFAQPDRVKSDLGVEPGAVTPFALINDAHNNIRTVIDADVMAADTAHFHPLVNDRTTAIAPGDLLKFLRAGGHDPRVLDFSAATADAD